MSVIPVVLIFFLVIIAAVFIVGGWIMLNVGRGVKRIIVGPAAKSQPASSHAVCSRADCRAENPEQAQFCRRCGEPLAARTAARGMKVA